MKRRVVALVTVSVAACYQDVIDGRTFKGEGRGVLIAAGTFPMGAEASSGSDSEHPRHDVTLAAFRIDATEVTVGDYLDWAKDHGAECAYGGGSGPCVSCSGDGCDVSSSALATHPMVGVTWYGAGAYCVAKGQRLPTEAEWERAAAGPQGARRFPWGNECPTSGFGGGCAAETWTNSTSRANCLEIDCHDGFDGTAPVGSFPLGSTPEGVLDLAGNALEWVEDAYHPTYDGAPANATAWTGGTERAGRGGGPGYTGEDLRVTARFQLDPHQGYFDVGFRCVSSP